MNYIRSNDNRCNIDALMISYYVKYNNMIELMNEIKIGNCTEQYVNIFIDLENLFDKFYRVSYYSDHKLGLTACVINLAAHYREFFKTRLNKYARIFLIYSTKERLQTVNYNKHKILYDDVNHYIESQLKLVQILCAYLPDVYYIKNESLFALTAHRIIHQEDNPNAYSFIITKDKFNFQMITMSPNTFVIRPKKNFGDDESYIVHKGNLLRKLCGNITNQKTLEYMQCIDPSLASIILSLIKNTTYNFNTVVSTSVLLRLMKQAIDEMRLLNSHTIDVLQIYNSLNLSKYLQFEQFQARYHAVDLHLLYQWYVNQPESNDTSWYINLMDRNAVHHIANTFFADKPIYIDVF